MRSYDARRASDSIGGAYREAVRAAVRESRGVIADDAALAALRAADWIMIAGDPPPPLDGDRQPPGLRGIVAALAMRIARRDFVVDVLVQRRPRELVRESWSPRWFVALAFSTQWHAGDDFARRATELLERSPDFRAAFLSVYAVSDSWRAAEFLYERISDPEPPLPEDLTIRLSPLESLPNPPESTAGGGDSGGA